MHPYRMRVDLYYVSSTKKNKRKCQFSLWAELTFYSGARNLELVGR